MLEVNSLDTSTFTQWEFVVVIVWVSTQRSRQIWKVAPTSDGGILLQAQVWWLYCSKLILPIWWWYQLLWSSTHRFKREMKNNELNCNRQLDFHLNYRYGVWILQCQRITGANPWILNWEDERCLYTYFPKWAEISTLLIFFYCFFFLFYVLSSWARSPLGLAYFCTYLCSWIFVNKRAFGPTFNFIFKKKKISVSLLNKLSRHHASKGVMHLMLDTVTWQNWKCVSSEMMYHAT